MKSRSKIRWSVCDWFDEHKPFDVRSSSARLFGVGINDIDVQTKPYDSVSNPVYTKWQRMLERAYCPKYKVKFPTYNDVYVCDEWLTFSKFRKDYLTMINDEEARKSFILDKDLLCKGNKIYCPEKCSLIPAKINSFLVTCNAVRGDLPIGVSKRSKGHKFMVTLSYDGLNRNLGDYNTPEEAFEVYKEGKESIAKSLAISHKHLLLEREFKALYEYQVEIAD